MKKIPIYLAVALLLYGTWLMVPNNDTKFKKQQEKMIAMEIEMVPTIQNWSDLQEKNEGLFQTIIEKGKNSGQSVEKEIDQALAINEQLKSTLATYETALQDIKKAQNKAEKLLQKAKNDDKMMQQNAVYSKRLKYMESILQKQKSVIEKEEHVYSRLKNRTIDFKWMNSNIAKINEEISTLNEQRNELNRDTQIFNNLV